MTTPRLKLCPLPQSPFPVPSFPCSGIYSLGAPLKTTLPQSNRAFGTYYTPPYEPLTPIITELWKSLRSHILPILMFGRRTTQPLHLVCTIYVSSCSHAVRRLDQRAIYVNERVYLIKWPPSAHMRISGLNREKERRDRGLSSGRPTST